MFFYIITTKIKKKMKLTVNIGLPTGWQHLNQKQLEYCLWLVSTGLPRDEIAVYALNSLGSTLITDENGTLVNKADIPDKERDGIVQQIEEQVAALLPHLKWLFDIPDTPVRLEHVRINGTICRARYDALMEELPLERYFVLDNLWQGYIHTRRDDLLDTMEQELYTAVRAKDYTDPRLPTEDIQVRRMNTLLWWSSVKRKLAGAFPRLFVQTPAQDDTDQPAAPPTQHELQRNIDTMLLILTAGDLSKEPAVLHTPVWRAMAYLAYKAEKAAPEND